MPSEVKLNICNNFHEEIVFEGETCPLCAAILERDSALAERDENNEALSARVEELLDERDALRTELRL